MATREYGLQHVSETIGRISHGWPMADRVAVGWPAGTLTLGSNVLPANHELKGMRAAELGFGRNLSCMPSLGWRHVESKRALGSCLRRPRKSRMHDAADLGWSLHHSHFCGAGPACRMPVGGSGSGPYFVTPDEAPRVATGTAGTQISSVATSRLRNDEMYRKHPTPYGGGIAGAISAGARAHRAAHGRCAPHRHRARNRL